MGKSNKGHGQEKECLGKNFKLGASYPHGRGVRHDCCRGEVRGSELDHSAITKRQAEKCNCTTSLRWK